MSEEARKRLARGLAARLFPQKKSKLQAGQNVRGHSEADMGPYATGYLIVEKVFVKPGTEEPTGEREVVVQEEVDLPGKNLVVRQARDLMAAMAAGLPNAEIDYIELGDPAPANPPTLDDTTLQQTTGQRKSTVNTVTSNVLQCVAVWLAGEGNGFTFTEAGLFTAPLAAGTMFARKAGFSIPKTNSFQLQFTWLVVFDVQDASGSGCTGVALIGSSAVVEDYIYLAAGGETSITVPIDFVVAAKRLEVFLFGQRLIPPDQYTEVLIGGGPAKGIQLNGFAANPGDKFYFRHLRW